MSGSPDRISGQSMFSDDEWTLLGELLHLSGKELAIVKHVFDDKSDCEIARELGISRHTVNTHLGRLYRKLGVHSRLHVVIAIFSEYLALLPQSPSLDSATRT